MLCDKNNCSAIFYILTLKENYFLQIVQNIVFYLNFERKLLSTKYTKIQLVTQRQTHSAIVIRFRPTFATSLMINSRLSLNLLKQQISMQFSSIIQNLRSSKQSRVQISSIMWRRPVRQQLRMQLKVIGSRSKQYSFS